MSPLREQPEIWSATGRKRISWKESTIAYREAARSSYFSTLLEENKQNPRYLFETVAKLTKKKASTPDVSKQHSSNDFMNFFTYKIDNISGRKL